MQINRLFEIIYILLDKEKVSAKELSQHFEVSTRTIYRDVETLSSAGIPIYMTKGNGGGISLLPDFVMNKAVLTDEEKNNILTALQSLRLTEVDSAESIISKLHSLFGENNTSFIEIDYNDWGNLIKEQFETAKRAILSHKLISFDYVSSQGCTTKRKVEPYALWFKDKTWYLKAFCLEKKAFRIFRLSRIRNVLCLNENYIPKKIDSHTLEYTQPFPITKIIMRIEASQKYRVYDDFQDNDIIENQDGSYTVTMKFVEDEWVYGYILSFGENATVLEPERVKDIIKKRLEENLKKYL